MNQHNSNGLRHGYWKIHYLTKPQIVLGMGWYNGGKRIGYWEFFDRNGNIENQTYYM